MVVLNNPISNKIDLPKKVVGKVIIGGASTEDSCSVLQHNIETTSPQLDNTQRWSRIIVEITHICESITLKYESEQAYMLPKSCIMEFF